MLKIDKDCYPKQHQEQEHAAMNVSLTPELEEFVATKVQSGRYNSASEVVREALRLLEEHEQARAAQIAAFNQELSQRLNSLDRGEHVDPAKARNRIQAKSAARKRLRA
jgi:antitoxin ParD1/3/4